MRTLVMISFTGAVAMVGLLGGISLDNARRYLFGAAFVLVMHWIGQRIEKTPGSGVNSA